MGLVQPEVKGDALMPTFSDVRPPSRLSKWYTKQTFYISGIAVKIRKFGRSGSGQLGRVASARGARLCDAVQSRN